ncbi:MAG TPA: hypothetical protein PK025_07065 [Spirochaetales bacterium]|nr:hypothetical protein [Spirochaetales bacterium]
MQRSCIVKGLFSFLLLATIFACKPLTYSTEPLHGSGGTAEGWVFTNGTIRQDGSATLYGTISSTRIIFTLSPFQTGEVQLGNIFDLRTVTYFDGTTNHLFSKGKYEITEITDTLVKGRMYIYSDTMTFNGTFTMQRTL